MQGTQRQLPGATLTHKAGAQLSAALKQERTTAGGSLLGRQPAQATLSKSVITEKLEQRDQREALRGQVRGLNTLEIGESSQKLEAMMARQKVSRRERHLKHLVDYENWLEAFYEQLRVNAVEAEEEWKLYSAASQREMTRTLDEFTDSYMVSREIEWVQAAYDHLVNHIRKRREEILGTEDKLRKIEKDRVATVNRFIKELEQALNDAAFVLPPQVEEILLTKAKDAQEVEKARLASLEWFMDGVQMEEEEVTKRYLERMQAKEQRWREVHHDQCVQDFMNAMNSPQFVNPPDRITLLEELKSRQEEVFRKRLDMLEELRTMPAANWSKDAVEALLKSAETLNEDAQKFYDEKIQEIVSFQATVDAESEELLEKLRVKLGYYKANDHITSFIDQECLPLVTKRKDDSKKLLGKCIQFLEKTDNRANDVLANIMTYSRDLGDVMDQHKATFKEEEQKHELALASRGDLMDEKVDDIEENLKNVTKEARESVTLGDLERNVQKCFELLDLIGGEYRSYVKEATELVGGHVPAIKITYHNFQEKVGKAFGLLPESKKEAYLDKIKEEKLKALEAEQLADPKKKPSKKDEPVIVLPQLEMWTAEDGSMWALLEPLEDVIRRLLFTEEDRELEEQRIKEEIARKEEEERKAAEEAALKKAKKDGKKQAQVEEVAAPVVETVVEEDPVPKDSDGTVCLATEVYITPAHVKSALETLRKKALEYVNTELASATSTAKSNDKRVQESIVNELDEKMRNLWPRKGRLEVTLVTDRTAEINKHHKRLERQMNEIQGKMDMQNKEFADLKEFLDAQVKQYQDVLAQAKEALTTAQTLSELQGIHLRVRDAQQLLFVNEQKSVRRMDQLASDEIDLLLKSNRDFLASFVMIAANGDYSEGEAKYYLEKIDPVNKGLSDSKQKRAAETAAYRTNMTKEREEPIVKFNKDYDAALESLAAREGLGKKYGAPRRSAQEKLRAEMTKCEVAQTGVEGLVSRLEGLLGEFASTQDHSRRPVPLSLDLRRVLLSAQTCMVHYGRHLEAFREEAKVAPLPMVTWAEDTETITPTPAEVREVTFSIGRTSQRSLARTLAANRTCQEPACLPYRCRKYRETVPRRVLETVPNQGGSCVSTSQTTGIHGKTPQTDENQRGRVSFELH